jgi:hypothetical protein
MHKPADATMSNMDIITSVRVPPPHVGFTAENELFKFLANKIIKFIHNLNCELLAA